DFFRGLMREDPHNPYHRRNVALASNDLAIALQANDKPREAAERFDEAVRLLEGLRARHPAPLAQFGLALGAAVAGPMQPPGQRWHAAWLMVVAETAAAEARTHRALLADAHLHRGNLRLALGLGGPAARDFQQAVPLYEQLHAEDPDDPVSRYRLGEACTSLGALPQGSDARQAVRA